ncbi:uncharacterized protein PSANT_03510 [Moesziomyces antarcticus]|uniref:Uncharacterized protein n=1 Tax=Pseudozyma antarctica TaxID=84753 RepID=A0A5C3FN70_PSEA2|nr:uncharacterized protein PSANT_03510 [Moesziomyces antarcticus]
MSRAPPLMPSSSGSHSYSSPKLGAAAIYSTSSPTGSPRPYFAQHLPGTLSPYRDASSRYAHLGSPRISSLSRDATAALKASSYPTSSSRPTSPTPGSRSPSPSSDSDASDASVSRESLAPGQHHHHDSREHAHPPLSRHDSSGRGDSQFARHDGHDEPGTSASAKGASADSPNSLRRAHQLQPIDTKTGQLGAGCSCGHPAANRFTLSALPQQGLTHRVIGGEPCCSDLAVMQSPGQFARRSA